jgi:hypothetical protein
LLSDPDLTNDDKTKGITIIPTANPAIKYSLSNFRNLDSIFMAYLLLMIIVGNVVNDKAKAQLVVSEEKPVGPCG